MILKLTNAKKNGETYLGLCPCHDDNKPSLSIKFIHGNPNPLIYCFAGCSFKDLKNYFEAKGLWVSTNGGYRNAFK